MTGVLDILRDPLAIFLLVIAIGSSLIIIAAVPSLSIFILKNTSFTIDKKQSIKVAAIGCVLIIIGLVGIVGLYQFEKAQPRATGEVEISPESPVTALSNGTQLNITVVTENPHPNFLQKILFKIFGEPKDLEFRFSLLDQSKNGTKHKAKMPNNYLNLKIFPTDAGAKIIQIEALSPRNETIYENEYVINLPSNRTPIIENFSYEHVGERIEIKVNAADPENDTIYYNFTRIPPSLASPISEIQPRWSFTEDSRILEPDKNSFGKNRIDVCILDGDKKTNKPWDNRKSVCKSYWITI